MRNRILTGNINFFMVACCIDGKSFGVRKLLQSLVGMVGRDVNCPLSSFRDFNGFSSTARGFSMSSAELGIELLRCFENLAFLNLNLNHQQKFWVTDVY